MLLVCSWFVGSLLLVCCRCSELLSLLLLFLCVLSRSDRGACSFCYCLLLVALNVYFVFVVRCLFFVVCCVFSCIIVRWLLLVFVDVCCCYAYVVCGCDVFVRWCLSLVMFSVALYCCLCLVDVGCCCR